LKRSIIGKGGIQIWEMCRLWLMRKHLQWRPNLVSVFSGEDQYLQTGEEEFSGIINNDMLPFRFGTVLLDI